LDKAQHVFELGLQGQDLGNVEAARQVVYGDREDPGDEDSLDRVVLAAGLDHLEEGAEEGIARSQVVVERIQTGCDELVGEVVVLVDDDEKARGLLDLNLLLVLN
jgi:hypothetical protein